MRIVLLLIAAVVAIIAAVAALKYSGNRPPPQQPAVAASQPIAGDNINTVDVLVAKTPISLGAIINESMVDKQPWPQHLVLEGFIVSGTKDSDVIGKVARSPFIAHEPLTVGKLGNPNDPSFLAATLPTGMRAITLATDAVTGIAGYIFPGDRVDILYTHNIPEEIKAVRNVNKNQSRPVTKPGVSEVVAANVRVLAVNTRQVTTKESSTAAPTNITVEISEEAAQKIRLGEKLGTLSLALRSIKDDNATVPNPTIIENLTQLRILESKEEQQDSVKIVRGAGKTGDDKKEGAATFVAVPPGGLPSGMENNVPGQPSAVPQPSSMQ